MYGNKKGSNVLSTRRVDTSANSSVEPTPPNTSDTLFDNECGMYGYGECTNGSYQPAVLTLCGDGNEVHAILLLHVFRDCWLHPGDLVRQLCRRPFQIWQSLLFLSSSFLGVDCIRSRAHLLGFGASLDSAYNVSISATSGVFPWHQISDWKWHFTLVVHHVSVPSIHRSYCQLWVQLA